MNLRAVWKLVRQTFSQWQKDRAPRLAAALAFYASFSLAPILVIALVIAGLLYDQTAARHLILVQMRALAGSQGEELIRSMLAVSDQLSSNSIATVFGVVILIVAATGVFVQLQDALNTIWEVQPRPGVSILDILRKRLFSFAMVIAVGFLLLVSLIVSAALSAISAWTLGLFPNFEIVLQIVNQVVSFLVITVVFALIFKFVPDADIAWRDVWLGSAVTALLFMIGKFAIGFYIGNSRIAGTFGAASALVVLLVWIYYSAQISFLGAEFTLAYANLYGSRVVPEEHAMPVKEQEREEQGMGEKSV